MSTAAQAKARFQSAVDAVVERHMRMIRAKFDALQDAHDALARENKNLRESMDNPRTMYAYWRRYNIPVDTVLASELMRVKREVFELEVELGFALLELERMRAGEVVS